MLEFNFNIDNFKHIQREVGEVENLMRMADVSFDTSCHHAAYMYLSAAQQKLNDLMGVLDTLKIKKQTANNNLPNEDSSANDTV